MTAQDFQQKLPFYGVAVAAFLLFLGNCFFILDETKQAIVLRFGEPRAVITQAGLKFKLPDPIESVTIFEKRILEVDPQPEIVNILSDKFVELISGGTMTEAGEKIPAPRSESQGMPISVDTFARYRITDPLKFLQRLRTEQNAEVRISNVMNDATRDVLGRSTLNELLSSDRSLMMKRIRDQVNVEMKEQGVEMVDVRIVRADLTDDLRTFTVNRMITQQREQATKTRASGQEQAVRIKSQADKERSIILATAQQQAQGLRGQGDLEAIKIYADAFNQDPEFYSFLRTMEAYKNTFSADTTQFIVSPSGEFLKYLKAN